MVLIREKEIEEYIPKGKKTTITIDDCLSGYALKFEAYGFRLIGSNKDNICFYGKNNETNFVLYNVTDLRFKNGDYKILYGQNNSFVRLIAEYA